jgi:hypothetical protein
MSLSGEAGMSDEQVIITDEALEELLREVHHYCEDGNYRGFCRCGGEWPCDERAALTELVQLRARVAALTAALGEAQKRIKWGMERLDSRIWHTSWVPDDSIFGAGMSHLRDAEKRLAAALAAPSAAPTVPTERVD